MFGVSGSGIVLPILVDSLGQILTSPGGGGGSGVELYPAQCRVSLSSVLAVPTSDITAATTVYLLPYNGDRLSLFDGVSAWTDLQVTSQSVSVPATTFTPFDIFDYNNAGSVALETVNWSSDTARATGLTLQNGIWCKLGQTSRRYMGTGRTTGVSGQIEDSIFNRSIWNYYNQVKRIGITYNSTSNWTYTTTSWRENNAGTGQVRFKFIIGLPSACNLTSFLGMSNTNAGGASVGIAIDAVDGSGKVASVSGSNSQYGLQSPGGVASLAAGYHYMTGIEYGNVTMTNFGSGGVTPSLTSTYQFSEARMEIME